MTKTEAELPYAGRVEVPVVVTNHGFKSIATTLVVPVFQQEGRTGAAALTALAKVLKKKAGWRGGTLSLHNADGSTTDFTIPG